MKHLLTVLLLAARVACAGDEVPSWLQELATAKTPVYPAKVPCVVLLDEERVVVEEGGRVTISARKAVKILTREGRREAAVRKLYATGMSKVKELRAWLVLPSGETRKYGKDNISDVALTGESMYDETRLKMIVASGDAGEGAVFGYESTTEEKSVFTQFSWEFQDRAPTLLSRYGLTLPSGWRAKSITYNHAAVEPVINGTSYTWEVRGLPYLEEEPASPSLAAMVPRLAVSFFPAEGAKTGLGRSLETWTDVSRWMTELSGPQATPTEALTAKAKALTSSAQTEFERIRAIAEFAQKVRYVAIQTSIAKGGGYVPHRAGDVFEKQYGDCKDKANLMRTMLQTIGIPSYLVSIYAGDRTYVRRDWASPRQFNHKIIAVKLSDRTNAPAVLSHPKLGRLLLFDPTDEFTPAGDLPEHEQGSYALVEAGNDGALVQVPVAPTRANRVEREMDVTLDADGSITARVLEQLYGQAAVRLRAQYRRMAQADYKRTLEHWISHGAHSASVAKLESEDAMDAGQFRLRAEFRAERYAQLMQKRLLVFRPAITPRRNGVYLVESVRQHPIVLPAQTFSETVRVALPPQFKVDELPDAGIVEAPFGKFEAKWEAKDGQLVFRRSLEVRAATLPAAEYQTVKQFFERIAGAEQAPVVLAKE